MEALITFSCIIGYGMMAGLSGSAFWNVTRARCRKGQHDYCDHDMAAIFGGAFWLLTLPGLLGAFLYSRVLAGNVSKPSLSRADRRREKEVEELNHRIRIAELEAKETRIRENFAFGRDR